MRRLYWKIQDILFDIKMWWQRKTRGYSDLEIWNLDDFIINQALPRLKAFRENTIGYPSIPGECESLEDWYKILDEMIFGLEFGKDEHDWYKDHVFNASGEERDKAQKEFVKLLERAQKGRELFGKWMMNLWW